MSAPYQPYQTTATTKVRRRTSHTFHLLMTIFTCGLWAIVWLSIVLWHKLGPRQKVRTITRG